MRSVAVVVMLCAGLGTAWGQSAPESAAAPRAAVAGATIHPESGSRLPLLRREDMANATSARIYDSLSAPGSEPPRGTIAIALYSPGTAAAIGRIDEYLRSESTLGPRLVGLLSLITAREMNLAYEWSVHEGPALLAGLEPEVVDAVRLNEPLIGLEQDDALFI
ncbi:MAG TPA: hypothetical protein VKQ06_13425, partial [Gammaproteobacteria bacterium]|nr:hypothetical protein [Gammaproteobacteria bacterium]